MVLLCIIKKQRNEHTKRHQILRKRNAKRNMGSRSNSKERKGSRNSLYKLWFEDKSRASREYQWYSF